MYYLTLEDILAIRADVAARAVNSCEVRTFHALMSALAAPRRSAFGHEVYPTLADKAGALLYALIQNHPFWDGNKRIASAALRLFVARNDARLDAPEAELRAFTRAIALGEVRDAALSAWMADRIALYV